MKTFERVKDITLNYEIADAITVCNLKECYNSMLKQAKEHEKLGSNRMHPEDYAYYVTLLPKIAAVLEYFGEKP